jgi:hypothetical protein
MKPILLLAIVTGPALGLLVSAPVQGRPAAPPESAQERLARLGTLLGTVLKTDRLPEKMSLARFLTALEARLPADRRVRLRLDEKAFGKELPALAAKEVKVPPAAQGTLDLHLRRALAQVPVEGEVDFDLTSGGLIITRPRLAALTLNYDFGDLEKDLPAVLPAFLGHDVATSDIDPSDAPALMVRLLVQLLTPRSWETIRVENGTRLVIFASPDTHIQVESLLAACRRLAGVAVVMNARIYELDRDFFVREVAPILARDPAADKQPVVAAIGTALFRKVVRGKFLQEGDQRPIRPLQGALFLSHQTAVRYRSVPPAKEATALAGVSFRVVPVVSADRRFVRLRIEQRSSQLVGIDKVRLVLGSTGKEVEIEFPNLRKTSAHGTVRIPDAGALLMPVDYRPAGKEGEGKVWVLVARPFIWIDEEVKEMRKQGAILTPKDIWESDVSDEKE